MIEYRWQLKRDGHGGGEINSPTCKKYTRKQNSAIREDKKELIPNAYSEIEYIQSLEKDGDIV